MTEVDRIIRLMKLGLRYEQDRVRHLTAISHDDIDPKHTEQLKADELLVKGWEIAAEVAEASIEADATTGKTKPSIGYSAIR